MTIALSDYRNGIFAFDADYVRPLLAAIHVVVDGGRVAVVDSGSYTALPQTLEALEALGLGPAAVDYVVLTHVHLDHAGGAGAMMAAFPAARLVVHPRGARHMADPAKLFAAVEAVYGAEEARRLYGTLLPVPAERIIAASDGQVLQLGGRELELLHTPGHARHHLCLHDRRARGVFTGDVLGLSYREFDVGGQPFLFPTTSPSQFDEDEMRQSIERVLALQPEALYLTHYSRVEPTGEVIGQLRRLLDGHVAIARAATGSSAERERQIRAGITRLMLDELHAVGCKLPEAEILNLLEIDLDLNAQGLAYWLDNQGQG